jgi:hypothetical protein
MGQTPPYFCAATETSRDIVTQYCKTAIGTLGEHEFDDNVVGNTVLEGLPNDADTQHTIWYLIIVYVDDFMALVIPTTKRRFYMLTGW